MNTNYKLIIFLILILIIIILFLFIIKSQKNNNIEKFTTGTDCSGWNNKDGSGDFCNKIGETNEYICFLKRIFCYITSIKTNLKTKDSRINSLEDETSSQKNELDRLKDQQKTIDNCRSKKNLLESSVEKKNQEISRLRNSCSDSTYSPEYEYGYESNYCDIVHNKEYKCNTLKNKFITKLETDNKIIEITKNNVEINSIDEPNKCVLKYDYKLNKYYDLTLINPGIYNADLFERKQQNATFTLEPIYGDITKCDYNIKNTLSTGSGIIKCHNSDYIDLLDNYDLRYINYDCLYDRIPASARKWGFYSDDLNPEDSWRRIDNNAFRKITNERTEFADGEFNYQDIKNLKTTSIVRGGDDNYFIPLLSITEEQNIDERTQANPLVWKIQNTKPSHNYSRFLNNRINVFVDHCEKN